MKSVALVTGAGRGLGRILATFLAGQGHDLVITSRTPTELHDVARSLESISTYGFTKFRKPGPTALASRDALLFPTFFFERKFSVWHG